MESARTILTVLDLTHQYLEGAIDGCDPDTLSRTFPGATIGSIGSIYAHAVYNEDVAFQKMIQGKEPIFITGGWAERTGLGLSDAQAGPQWTNPKLDLAPVQEYARVVYDASNQYLQSVTDADLERPIDFFGRKETAAWVIGDMVLVHLSEHSGEIAALKGVMGQKGLPW